MTNNEHLKYADKIATEINNNFDAKKRLIIIEVIKLSVESFIELETSLKK
jgi:hypothetical protein